MGQPEAGMGVDAGDFDGDGDLDLFLSHLTRETNTLYQNDSEGLFEDLQAATLHRHRLELLHSPPLPHGRGTVVAMELACAIQDLLGGEDMDMKVGYLVAASERIENLEGSLGYDLPHRATATPTAPRRSGPGFPRSLAFGFLLG